MARATKTKSIRRKLHEFARIFRDSRKFAAKKMGFVVNVETAVNDSLQMMSYYDTKTQASAKNRCLCGRKILAQSKLNVVVDRVVCEYHS